MNRQVTNRYFPFFKSKLARRLSLYIFGVTVATALLVSAVQIVWEYRAEKQALKEEFEQIRKINLKSIEEDLWILNIASLRTTLNGLLQKRNFVYFRLTDDRDKVLAEAGKLPEYGFLIKKVPLYHNDAYGKNVYIGTLSMVATTEYIRNDIIHHTVTTLAILLITMMLVGFFILLLVWLLVTKHLYKIQNYTHEIRFDKPIPPLKLDRNENRWTRDDVLSSLADTINGMRTMIRDSYSRLEYQSLHDALTDLPNRRSLRIDLEKRIRESKESQKYSALSFIDLDSFKVLNDSLGHTVGDKILIEITRRLKRLEERGLKVYRIGGDEFLVLTPPLCREKKEAQKTVQLLAEEIRHLFDENIRLDDKTLKITASIGIELFRSEQDIETVMKHADNALYKAKEKGRNNIAFFNEQMQSSTDRRLELEQILHHAIENDRFIIYYQPKFDRERKLCSAEALTRLQHEDGTLIPPVEFIPFAEETGLILEIDRMVIRKVFRFVLENRINIEKSGMKSIAINISSAQFMMADFVQFIITEADRFSIDPHSIILEITEEAVVSNIEHTIETMLALKQHGFQFSIDDFGTGYSSLHYLMNLPLDELKIDKSFVDHILDNERSVAVVQTIITLAQNLRLSVVAEGVENDEQFRALYQYGSTVFQGYLFSRPIPEEEFSGQLAEV